MMEQNREKYAALLDTYGVLLTKHQYNIMYDYYFEDVQDFINTMKEYEEDDNQYVYYAWW